MSLHKATFHELASQQNHPRQFAQVLCTSDVQLFENVPIYHQILTTKIKGNIWQSAGRVNISIFVFC